MEWQQLLNGALSSSPVAAILGFVTWKLWSKLEQKDAEIQRLNEARVKDMLEVAHRED